MADYTVKGTCAVGVAIGKGMGWNPSLHQKEHEKLVQKNIYSYKSIR